MIFLNVKSRLYQILILLGVILVLISVSYLISWRAGKWDQKYYRIVYLESRLTQVISGDSKALGKEDDFVTLVNDYKQFRTFCTECHSQRTTVLEDRLQILRKLHENVKMKSLLKDEVRDLMGMKLKSVQNVYGDHVTTLKQLIHGYSSDKNSETEKKSFSEEPTRLALELKSIGQIFTVQNSLTSILNMLYLFDSSRNTGRIENDFNRNMEVFYREVKLFDENANDYKDGLFVKDLMESGRVFEKNILDLAHLEKKSRILFKKLQNNSVDIGDAVTKVGLLIDDKRAHYKRQAVTMTWGSMFTVLIVLFLIFIRNREIVTSIQSLVRETEKIKGDSSYQINLTDYRLEEFHHLAQSLNIMAAHISDNVRRLHQEVSERVKADRRLETEKKRLAVTLESIGDGVITTDIDGRITGINKVAASLTGWSQSAAIGNLLDDVFKTVNEETRDECESPVQKVLFSGRISGLTKHTFLIAKDGMERPIAASGAPIYEQDDIIIGVVLVFRDVSEERQLANEMSRTEKLESVGVLAGGIAHDFNNILVGILGNINLATHLIPTDHEASQLLKDAEKASLRAKTLTGQLLTFSKGGEPIKETTSVRSIIRESVEFILSGKNVRCEYDIDEELWLVNIDRGQVSQVIQNLIINSCHAMPGGGSIEIGGENVGKGDLDSLLPLEEDNYVRITLRDYGIGISKKIRDKIFDPYFTTKQHGSGLGLAICYSIITQHDGYILVESQPNKGTVFTIYLPAIRDHEAAEKVFEDQAPVRGSGKILIMDDDDLVCSATTQMLDFFGYTVVTSRDGEEAISIYKEAEKSGNPIDALIMDLTIPGGMGGEETIQEILKLNQDARVIVSSGYANNTVMANYRDYGFKAALVKPFELAELTRVVGEITTSTG